MLGDTEIDGPMQKGTELRNMYLSNNSCQQIATKYIYKTQVWCLPNLFNSLFIVTNKPSEVKSQCVKIPLQALPFKSYHLANRVQWL